MATLGRFELRGQLGRGGMGVVYRAYDPSLGREVALKGLHADDDVEAIARFKREAREAARLRHPRIVSVHEFSSGMDEKTGREVQFMVMDLIEGTSLAAMLEKGPMAPATLLPIISEVADALGYAHHNGVVHRDVKPGNVLLDAKGAAYLTDFGLARPTHRDTSKVLTESGAIMGTIAYMAPEQARGDSAKVGPPADVYALGATIYHGLTGRLPIDRPEQFDMLRAIVEVEPEPLPGDHDLRVIVMKCLSKESERRYRDGADLASDLRRYLAGESIVARPSSLGYRIGRRLRKNPAAWGLGAAAAIALTVVAAIVLVRHLQTRQRMEDGRRFENAGDIENALAAYTAAGSKADVDRLTPRLKQLQWARRLQIVYFELLYTHGGLLDKLTAAGYAEAKADPSLLADLRKAIEAIKALAPELKTPDAILAWGRLMCGDLAAEEELLSIRDSPERPEPFLNLLRARWHLKAYARDIQFPTTVLRRHGRSAMVPRGTVTPQMQERHDKAMAELRVVEATAVWGDLPWAAVYRKFADGMAALLDGRREAKRYDDALAAFESISRSLSDIRLESKVYGGLAALLNGNAHRAFEFWTEALADQPRWPKMYEWRAKAYQVHGMELESKGLDGRNALRTSVEDAVRALDLRPGDPAVLVDRAMTREFLAIAFIDRGESPGRLLDDAAADLETVHSQMPDWPSIHAHRGHIDLTRGQMLRERGKDAEATLDRAVEAFDRELAKDPANTAAFHNRVVGVRERALARWDRGVDSRPDLRDLIEELSRRLEAAPKERDLLEARSVTRGELGKLDAARGEDPRADFAAALADVDAIVANDASDFHILYNRATLFYWTSIADRHLGDDPADSLKSARDAYTRCLELRPGVARVLRDRGDVNVLLKDLTAAAEDFREAAENDYGQPDDVVKLAGVLAELDRAKEAEEACGRGLERWPKAVSIRFTRGATRIQLGMLEAALEDTDEVIKADPRLWTAHENRAVILSRMGRHRESAEAYDEAAKLNPSDASLKAKAVEERTKAGSDF